MSYSIGATPPVSVAHAPLIALSTGNVVVFWLFTRALFDEAFKLRWWHALIWAAVAAFSFVNCMWIAPGSRRAAVHHRDQSARARLHRAGGHADDRLLVGRSGRAPPQRPRLHRRRRGALWRAECDPADRDAPAAAAAEIANTVNCAVLAGIVAAICYAMMRVDGADLFPAPASQRRRARRSAAAEAERGRSKARSMR